MKRHLHQPDGNQIDCDDDDDDDDHNNNNINNNNNNKTVNSDKEYLNLNISQKYTSFYISVFLVAGFYKCYCTSDPDMSSQYQGESSLSPHNK